MNAAVFVRMNATEHERLKVRLARLRRLLLLTTDPAVAAILRNDIADIETRLRADQSPTDSTDKDSS
jgi:hypothetical protein